MSLLDAAKAGDLTRVGELLKGGRDVLQQKTDVRVPSHTASPWRWY